jgi:hypothetical protein
VFRRRKTSQGKSQSPGARRAGGRETNLLKPLDSLIHGMGASLQAVAQANAQVASKVSSPGGRACNREGEGSMGRRRLADAADHSGGVGATAWGQGHAKQLEKPSASRRANGGARDVVEPETPGKRRKMRGGRRGPEERCSGGMPVERRDPAVWNSSAAWEAGARGPRRPGVCTTCNGRSLRRRRLHRPGGAGACRCMSAQ